MDKDSKQMFKDGKSLMCPAPWIEQYQEEGWVLGINEPRPPDISESDVTLEEWTEMLNSIKGEGAKKRFEDIGRSIGVEVDISRNPVFIRSQLIDAYSEKNS